MKKWLAVLLGLVALAILCFFCIRHHSHDMQNDITERSKATLQETGLPWASATVDGRDVTLTGTAPSAPAKMQAQRIIEGVSGVRGVDNQITVSAPPPKVPVKPVVSAPYRTAISYNGQQVTLSGSSPDANAANFLVAQARQRLNPSVANRLTAQGDAPAGWSAVTGALIPQMKRFVSAEATVSNNDVAFAGTLPAGSNVVAVRQALNASLPQGYTAAYAIQAQPVAPAPQACPPVAPEKICPPIPAPTVCPPAPECPAYNGPAEATLYDAVPVADVVEYANVVEYVDAVDYQGCQDKFDRLMSGAADVLFRISKAIVTSKGRQLISRIATVAEECPSANLQIAGHTDSRGDRSMNQDLSERRARAVLRALTEFGVDSYRLSAVGYGESSPIATNETIAGRQANRRVEIIVEGL